MAPAEHGVRAGPLRDLANGSCRSPIIAPFRVPARDQHQIAGRARSMARAIDRPRSTITPTLARNHPPASPARIPAGDSLRGCRGKIVRSASRVPTSASAAALPRSGRHAARPRSNARVVTPRKVAHVARASGVWAKSTNTRCRRSPAPARAAGTRVTWPIPSAPWPESPPIPTAAAKAPARSRRCSVGKLSSIGVSPPDERR